MFESLHRIGSTIRHAPLQRKPVEIIFENSDLMPHNFVVVQPGALEEVGTLAEATATQPGAIERQYHASVRRYQDRRRRTGSVEHREGGLLREDALIQFRWRVVRLSAAEDEHAIRGLEVAQHIEVRYATRMLLYNISPDAVTLCNRPNLRLGIVRRLASSYELELHVLE